MNWHARPQRLGSDVREMPQSVHRERGGAGVLSAWLITWFISGLIFGLIFGLILGLSGPTPGARLVEDSTLASSATCILYDCLTTATNCKTLFA